jgi:hypothetical protein
MNDKTEAEDVKKSRASHPPVKIGIRIEESWPWYKAESMVGGTIRRKLIHRESFRTSVLHHSENPAVLPSIAAKRCLLTTPSLLSRPTQKIKGRAKTSQPQHELPEWYYPLVDRSIVGGTDAKG